MFVFFLQSEEFELLWGAVFKICSLIFDLFLSMRSQIRVVFKKAGGVIGTERE